MQPEAAAPLRRHRPWWWADALLWAFTASVVAPTVFTLSISAVAMIRGAGMDAFGAVLFIGPIAFIRTFQFALLPYSAILLIWAAVAPYITYGERSRLQLIGLSASLALAAGIGAFSRDGEAEWELGVWVWSAACIGLLLPRLVVPRLRHGALCRSRVDTDGS